jgi:hypothetical protein
METPLNKLKQSLEQWLQVRSYDEFQEIIMQIQDEADQLTTYESEVIKRAYEGGATDALEGLPIDSDKYFKELYTK